MKKQIDLTSEPAPKSLPLTAINRIRGANSPAIEFHGDLFCQWLQARAASTSTQRHYSRAVGRWIRHLNAQDEKPAIAWYNFTAGASEKRMIGFAARRYEQFSSELLEREINLGIPSQLPPCSRPNPRPFLRGELRAILNASRSTIRNPHTRIAFRLFLRTLDSLALRRSEGVFDWDEIDFVLKEILISGKGGDRRRLPLPTRLCALLRWWKERSPTAPWTGVRGRQMKPDTLYRLFKRAARKAGFPAAKLHLTRHTRLTAMASAPGGYDPIHLRAFSGHRHLSSLLHYCQPQMPRLRELMEASL